MERSSIAPTSFSCVYTDWNIMVRSTWLDKPPHHVKVGFIKGFRGVLWCILTAWCTVVLLLYNFIQER